MRILHILDHSLPLHSSYSCRTMAVLRQQHALGWQTIQLTGVSQGKLEGCGAQDEQEIEGWHFFRTLPLDSWWARQPLLHELAAIVGLSRRLHQVAQHAKPHLLHAHSPSPNAIAALRVGRALGLPVVYEIRALWEHSAAVEHGLAGRLSRRLERHALQRADALTTTCHGLRDELLSRGIEAGKVTVIPNAVDVCPVRQPAAGNVLLAHKLGLTGHLVLGYVGSFHPSEGLELLLRAMPSMLAAVPSLRLLLVGGGPQDAELRALARQLGMERRVIFAGPVAQSGIADYYQMIDVLVYPRLPMGLSELVTPLKPLEAMAHGRLLVASDVGGHREIIENGKTGILFKAGDGLALSEAVLGLLRHADSWPALRQAARRYVELERNWGASVARYGALYRELLARRQP